MRLVIAGYVVLIACGDNGIPHDPVFSGLSGSRIKLQWYLYQDGARQLETAAFYDARLHVRCEPKLWSDGVTRCAPIADSTVFRDAECMLEVGHTISMRTPKYFIGYDHRDGELRATRLLRAGARLDLAPPTFFAWRDGVCEPTSEPVAFSYFEATEQVDVGVLAEVWPEQVEGERLALQVLASHEGLSAPTGYHDRALDVACRPELRPDGSSACVPTAAVPAVHFADPYCEVRLFVGLAPPRALRIPDANGCTLYHAAGREHASLVYRREGTTCVRVILQPGEHAYQVGDPLALAAVERTVEDDADRRLQRIAIAAGPMRTLDDRLYDTATRSECRSYGNGELAVCVPTNAATATRLFANDKCGRELLVADLPRVQCSPAAFAVADAMSIHAIGARYTGTLYTLDAVGQCKVRPPVPDHVPHVLGPPIPPTTFVAGVVFSER